MTGLRKRVTVGFLSIVCLLFFSGMVSFLELSHMSRDTEDILKANKCGLWSPIIHEIVPNSHICRH